MKPIFTQEHIDLWYAELEGKIPAITELEWPEAPQIMNFRGQPLTAGVAIRMQSRDGSFQDVVMNPAMARELAHWIFDAGQKAGWLDKKFNVCPPPPAPFDA